MNEKQKHEGRELVFLSLSAGNYHEQQETILEHGLEVTDRTVADDVFTLLLKAQKGDRINVASFKNLGLDATDLARFLAACCYQQVRVRSLTESIPAADSPIPYEQDVPWITVLELFASIGSSAPPSR